MDGARKLTAPNERPAAGHKQSRCRSRQKAADESASVDLRATGRLPAVNLLLPGS